MILKKYYFLVAVLCLLLTACSDDSGGDDTVAATCATPTTLATAQITETSVTVSWSATGQGTFTVEYGPSGFTQGTGTSVTSSTTSITITGLQPDTNYQAYVRFNCSNGASSSQLGPLSFTTAASIACPEVTDINSFEITESSATIGWSNPEGITTIDVEYGLRGFTPGQGTVRTTSENFVNLTNLEADSEYDYYVTSQCSGVSGVSQGPFIFMTEPLCVAPDSLDLASTTTTSIFFGWNSNGETSFQIEYGLSGFSLGSGTTIDLSNSDTLYVIENLEPSTTYEIYVRSNCGSDGFSQYSDALVATTDTFTGFTGNYLVEQVSPSIFGFDTFDPDGGGEIFFLHGPDTAGSQTTENVNLAGNERAFDAVYLASQGFGNPAETYVMKFVHTLVNLSGEETTGVQCSQEVKIGPTSNASTTDPSNDTVFLLTFRDDITEDCGAGSPDVTLRFTKQ